MHNNYLTLPVVFLMIANHYPLLFATRYNWLIVADRAGDRAGDPPLLQFRHEGSGSPWWTWGVAAAGMIAVGWLSSLGPRETKTGELPKVDVEDGPTDIVLSRCSMCHAKEPFWPGVTSPPKDIVLDSRRAITQHARLIDINAVRSSAMPPGNITEITPARARDAGRLAMPPARRRNERMRDRPPPLSARPDRLRPQSARSALAGRRARRGAVRAQLRGRRREQHPARRRRLGSLPVRRARRGAVAGRAAHECRVDVRIRLARRLLAAVAHVHRRATCR